MIHTKHLSLLLNLPTFSYGMCLLLMEIVSNILKYLENRRNSFIYVYIFHFFHLLKMSETTCFVSDLLNWDTSPSQMDYWNSIALNKQERVVLKTILFTFVSNGCECKYLNITLIYLSHSLVENLITF